MARGWKEAVERTLSGAGIHKWVLRLRAPSSVILTYHNVVPAGERAAGDLGLHVPQADFARHLDVIAETHDVVPLPEALEPVPPGGRPRAAITFDDAYAGSVTAGVDELTKRGFPGTIMVAPGILGAPLWWDLLAPAGGGPLNAGLRQRCLAELRGEQARIVAWAESEGLVLSDLPEHAIPAEEAAVLKAAGRPGVYLGVHTWSHPNLAALDAQECAVEMTRARQWVAERTAVFHDWLAYPYGLTSSTASDTAAGIFDGALLVRGGLAVRSGRRQGSPAAVPRVNVPRTLTPQGLRLRVAGLLG